VAAAGTATSTKPMVTPKPNEASATVRIPALVSAPSRLWCSGLTNCCPRTTGASAKVTAPMIMQTPAATTPVPGHGAAISNPASAGPRMKHTSMLIAS
jgi:hypothetical protein